MKILMVSLLSLLFYLCACSAHAASADDVLAALDRQDWKGAYSMSRSSQDTFIRSLAWWYYLMRSDQLPPAEHYAEFIKAHPRWPKIGQLRKRMERSFLSSEPSNAEVLSWFSRYPPQSSRGLLLQRIAAGTLDVALLDTLWAEADLSDKEQRYVLTHYGKHLTRAAHERRVERLVWEGQLSDASSLLPKLSRDKQALYTARIALKNQRSGVDSLVAAVPSSLQQDAGLIYDRMRFRARKRNYDGAKEMLLAAPARLPYAADWWDVQKRVIRDAIEDRQYSQARALLDKHSQIEALPRVEAEWLRGWLYLHFLRKPSVAAPAFENIYQTASMPISRSRGAYWAGRAHEAAGDQSTAVEWYQRAAAFPITFYGQLAHQYLHPGTPLPLPQLFSATAKEVDALIARNPVAQAFSVYASSNRSHLLWPYVRDYLREHGSPAELIQFAGIAREAGALPMGIRIAQEGLTRGIYIAELYPVMRAPSDLAIDPAFAFAIARQESRFDVDARSRANARGLMQLLPSTAKRTARAHGIDYSASRLNQPRYNMILGSHYMDGLLQRFDNTYILAIAGYNAGPGRSDQWQERFGRLDSSNWRENIQWSEMIPFSETRNYVQRVLENYHVYRHLFSGGKATLRAREQLLANQ